MEQMESPHLILSSVLYSIQSSSLRRSAGILFDWQVGKSLIDFSPALLFRLFSRRQVLSFSVAMDERKNKMEEGCLPAATFNLRSKTFYLEFQN